MTLFGNPDQFIVEAFSTGKNVEQATRRLYDLYWGDLIAFVVSKGAKPEDAGDYAQESILKLLDKIQTAGFDLDRKEGLKTYLFTIAKHHTWQQLRHGARATGAEWEFTERTDDERYGEIETSEWLTAEREASAWEKFERLGELCRKLLLMFLDGGSAEDICRQLGMGSPTHVRVQKKRCLDKLSKN
ncbi:MAG: RNA polymerase sigma factor [Dyadobacter fermentans]